MFGWNLFLMVMLAITNVYYFVSAVYKDFCPCCFKPQTHRCKLTQLCSQVVKAVLNFQSCFCCNFSKFILRSQAKRLTRIGFVNFLSCLVELLWNYYWVYRMELSARLTYDYFSQGVRLIYDNFSKVWSELFEILTCPVGHDRCYCVSFTSTNALWRDYAE